MNNPYEKPPQWFKPKTGYADDKGKDIGAIKAEIENVFVSGMSKLMDDEALEI